MKGNNSFTPYQGFQCGYEKAKAMLRYMVRGGRIIIIMSKHLESGVIRRQCNFCRSQAVQHVGSTDFCNRCLLYKLMELQEPLATHLVESDKLL
jgi:hypothetical protein